MERLRRIFEELRERAGRVAPWLRHVRLERCRAADREHAESARQHMHVGHRPGVVCHANAARRLDAAWQRGLVAHELGHLAVGLDRSHDERDADRVGGLVAGVRVERRGPRSLEWAEDRAMPLELIVLNPPRGRRGRRRSSMSRHLARLPRDGRGRFLKRRKGRKLRMRRNKTGHPFSGRYYRPRLKRKRGKRWKGINLRYAFAPFGARRGVVVKRRRRSKVRRRSRR